MKTHCIALTSLLLLATAAPAGVHTPFAAGEIFYKEKLKIGGGCDSFSTAASLDVWLYNDLTWTAVAPWGTFDGPLQPAGKPGVFNLQFGPASQSAYRMYLEEAATILCGTPVSIPSPQVETLQVKIGKSGSSSVSLRASATGTSAFGSARGTHQLKGKGVLALP